MKFFEYKATNVDITNTHIIVTLESGEKASLPISDFPLLQKASKAEREDYTLINGYAIYWQQIGEDLSVAGFFNTVNTSTPQSLHT